MATTALDEIDSGGHNDALTVETEGKQAEASAKPASKIPLNITTKPPPVADQVTRRATPPSQAPASNTRRAWRLGQRLRSVTRPSNTG